MRYDTSRQIDKTYEDTYENYEDVFPNRPQQFFIVNGHDKARMSSRRYRRQQKRQHFVESIQQRFTAPSDEAYQPIALEGYLRSNEQKQTLTQLAAEAMVEKLTD